MEIEITGEWNNLLDYFPVVAKDIYFEEAYVKLYESASDEAVCCVCREGEAILLFPFLRRRFIYQGSIWYDFETPYGYGGPIANTDDSIFINAALNTFRGYCEENNYVAGFLRFHPLLNNQRMYEIIGEVINDRQTVAIDLTLPEEDIWMHEIHTQNRNVIKKGEKSGLSFIVDDKFQYLMDFIHLYNETMRKLSADNFYFFDDNYYRKLERNISNRFLGLVMYNSRVISGAIFFYSERYGHYHLSGSDRESLSLSPNNYMLYKAALELRTRGVSKFHLGGGTTADGEDSLFRFKGRFSKQRYQFAIGKTIFNPNIYKQLCYEWEIKFPDKQEKYKHFLLKYKY